MTKLSFTTSLPSHSVESVPEIGQGHDQSITKPWRYTASRVGGSLQLVIV